MAERRCGTNSASTRRSGGSAFRTTAQLLGADDVILSHAAKVGGACGRLAFLHRLEAVAEKSAGKWRKPPVKNMSVSPMNSTGPRRSRRFRSRRQPPRDTALETIGHRDRGPLRRSLYDLCAVYPETLRRSIRSTCCRLRIAARRSTTRSANSRRPTPLPFPPIPRAPCAKSAKYFEPLMERPEARALWWPRFCASRPGLPIGKPLGAAMSPRSMPRSAVRSPLLSTTSGYSICRQRRPDRAAA